MPPMNVRFFLCEMQVRSDQVPDEIWFSESWTENQLWLWFRFPFYNTLGMNPITAADV